MCSCKVFLVITTSLTSITNCNHFTYNVIHLHVSALGSLSNFMHVSDNVYGLGSGMLLASSPGLLIGGRGKEGLVSTACACAVIIQILNNLITYGYRLYTFTDTFTVKYTENVAHAHAVDTRPSPPSPQSEGLGTRLVCYMIKA